MGGAFVAVALMFWPVHISRPFDPDGFGQIRDPFHFWTRMYRIHLCGMIVNLAPTFPPGAVPG